MSDFHIVIPARYASTRLPGKPLADVAGKPMIVRVAEQASDCGASSVVVATDDERVLDVVKTAGFDALMTNPAHQSGSERLMEVADLRGWPDSAVLINVQGDEPLIPPAVIQQVAQAMQDGSGQESTRPVVTLCEPIQDRASLFDPNAVKVVFDKNSRALYFSRAPIPFDRDEFTSTSAVADSASLSKPCWWRHIGIYGYRLAALRQYMATPVAEYERLEALEQLRFLDSGVDVYVFPACAPVPAGVDTAADLAAANAMFEH